MGNAYNGLTWPERMAKFKEMNRRLATGELAPPLGPCRLCNDPGGSGTDVTFEFHDESYSQDYSWAEPDAYAVCRDCHVYRIHQRGAHPESWQVFLAHVRRGGYAREMREAEVRSELSRCRKAILSGEIGGLTALRPYAPTPGQEWFSRLSTSP